MEKELLSNEGYNIFRNSLLRFDLIRNWRMEGNTDIESKVDEVF